MRCLACPLVGILANVAIIVNNFLNFAQWGVLGPLAAGFSGKVFTVMVEEEERGPFSVPVLIQVTVPRCTN